MIKEHIIEAYKNAIIGETVNVEISTLTEIIDNIIKENENKEFDEISNIIDLILNIDKTNITDDLLKFLKNNENIGYTYRNITLKYLNLILSILEKNYILNKINIIYDYKMDIKDILIELQDHLNIDRNE